MSVQTYAGPRDALNWYIEPTWCVHALLDAEVFDGPMWDPACGSGNIPSFYQSYMDQDAYGTDIADRGFGSRFDFLNDHAPLPFGSVPNIICNPPYDRHTPRFIERALAVAERKVAMIVQQQFPYSGRRHDLFTKTPLARLYFLSDRPSMPPGELLTTGQIEAKGGSVDYLWMVWDKSHKGPPSAHWLRKPPTDYDPHLDAKLSYDAAISACREKLLREQGT